MKKLFIIIPFLMGVGFAQVGTADSTATSQAKETNNVGCGLFPSCHCLLTSVNNIIHKVDPAAPKLTKSNYGKAAEICVEAGIAAECAPLIAEMAIACSLKK